MKKQFDGKTALVTGGGTGIGRAVAIGLAAEGCTVTVAGRTGQLDFAVNSVGIDGGDNAMPTVDHSMDILDQMIATNVRGMFLSMKHQIRQMLPFKADGGPRLIFAYLKG